MASKTDKNMGGSDVKIWRIHLKTDIGEGLTRQDLLQFCQENNLIGVGWSKIDTCVISIRDYHFESSSAAAAVILGRAANPVSKIGNLHTCYKGMGIMASNDCPIQYKKTAAVPGMSPSPTITDSPLTEPALPSSVPTPFVPNANAITLASRTPARPGFGFTTAQVPKTSIQSRTLPL